MLSSIYIGGKWMQHLLRNIPSVHDVLEQEKIDSLIHKQGRQYIKSLIVQGLDTFRNKALTKELDALEYQSKDQAMKWIVTYVNDTLHQNEEKGLRRMVNGTGVLLHTNMGRAPLPKVALDRIVEIAGGYSNLEYNIEGGKRGSRYDYVETILTDLTGAESAMVVNNNAAAVFIALNTLAVNQEVIISRSEQVEIGGSFRIPDIINRSGARMVEVGTTNKTYMHDYEEAITEETAVLLKVHKSNYRIEGFTADVNGSDIGALARGKELIAMEDLGSGCLVDMRQFDLPHEPTVKECVEKGIDIITFSGDKLLGGPQAGIIVGKKDLIEQMKKNPLTRMVRIDKLSLIALENVLQLYRNETMYEHIPIMTMLHRDDTQLEENAKNLIKRLRETLNDRIQVCIINEENNIGGGALPGAKKRSMGLAISSPYLSAVVLQQALRKYAIPIIVRIKDDHIELSMRTLFSGDDDVIVHGLCDIINKVEGKTMSK